MYTIEHKLFGALEELRLVNVATREWLSIIPGMAATINGLVLKAGSKKYELINGCRNYQELMTEGKKVFKGTKLFPFPNRINKGQYSFDNKNYQLELNFPLEGHAIHGLVYESAFDIINKTANEDEASVELEYDYDGSNSGYPFKYKLIILFSLSEKGFACKTTIENTDNQSIPIGDGWHPYFKLESKVNDLCVKIPSTKIVLVNEKMIPNGLTSASDQFTKSTKIAEIKFDTCYKLEEKEGRQQVELVSEKENLQLAVWQETGKNKYNYVQIYTPPSRDCIAIEPMTCMPDAFNNKNGLIVLKAGETVNFSYGVELKIKKF